MSDGELVARAIIALHSDLGWMMSTLLELQSQGQRTYNEAGPDPEVVREVGDRQRDREDAAVADREAAT